MPALKTYHLFISHAWQYNADYYRLVEMLDAAPYFSWKNYSVPQHDPLATRTDAGLERALQRQIAPTHIVVIIAGMYAHYREWLQKEIDMAVEMGKPIIGIKPRGQERIPKAVQEAARVVVGWSTTPIVDAIRQNTL
jgi:Thoeris protein ThsB, TIR-like domain